MKRVRVLNHKNGAARDCAVGDVAIGWTSGPRADLEFVA